MNRTVRSRVARATVLAGAVLLAAPLGAQAPVTGDDARPISLREAITEAQRNAPAIVSAYGLERNADAAYRSARGAYLPTLSITAGSAKTNGVQFFQGQLVPLTGNPWNYNNGITANLQLFDGNSRWSELARVRATQHVADVSLTQAKFDAELQVKTQYYAALAARESEAAATAQLEERE